MKKVGIEPCITIGLEYLPDDVQVYCLTEEKLLGLLRVAVISGMLAGGSVIALGIIVRAYWG